MDKLANLLRALNEHNHLLRCNVTLAKLVENVPQQVPVYFSERYTCDNTVLAIKGERGLPADFPLEFLMVQPQLNEDMNILKQDIDLLYKFQTPEYEAWRKFLFEQDKPNYIAIPILNKLIQLSSLFGQKSLDTLIPDILPEILVKERQIVNYTRGQANFQAVLNHCVSLVQTKFAKIYNIDRCVFYLKVPEIGATYDVVTRQIFSNLIIYCHYDKIPLANMLHIKHSNLFLSKSFQKVFDINFVTIYMKLEFTASEQQPYFDFLKIRSMSKDEGADAKNSQKPDLTLSPRFTRDANEYLVNMAEDLEKLNLMAINLNDTLVIPDYTNVTHDFQQLLPSSGKRARVGMHGTMTHVVYNGDIYDIYFFAPDQQNIPSYPDIDATTQIYRRYIPTNQVATLQRAIGDIPKHYYSCFTPTNPLLGKQIKGIVESND